MVAHGGRLEVAARAWGCRPVDILDLSTGVYPEPDREALARRLAELAPVVGRYPDPDGEPARSALAGALGVNADTLLLGAGAQAFVEVVFAAFRWGSVALKEPNYAEVRRCAERSGVAVRPAPLDGSWPAADVVWVTDPHSPTGRDCPLPEAAQGVLDESYAELERRRRTRVAEAWIRIGSLTKCFSMPGLRLGYAIASPARIEALRSHLPPWPAPTLALHLLPDLLPGWSARDAAIRRGRERLHALLERRGWRPEPSSASFILAEPPGVTPDFARHRILVREFRECPALGGRIRFGIPGDESGWRRLEAALCR